jgi:hypothetical protein
MIAAHVTHGSGVVETGKHSKQKQPARPLARGPSMVEAMIGHPPGSFPHFLFGTGASTSTSTSTSASASAGS